VYQDVSYLKDSISREQHGHYGERDEAEEVGYIQQVVGINRIELPCAKCEDYESKHDAYCEPVSQALRGDRGQDQGTRLSRDLAPDVSSNQLTCSSG
jgi:hypothetical protein